MNNVGLKFRIFGSVTPGDPPQLQEVDAAEKLAVHRVAHLHRWGWMVAELWQLHPLSEKESRELNEYPDSCGCFNDLF